MPGNARSALAALAAAMSGEGERLNRRKDRRDAMRMQEEQADAAQRRALALLAARPSKENTQVVTGEDEDGPGIFLVDKDTGTKERIRNAPSAAPDALPRRSLLRKPGDAMPIDAPPIPVESRAPSSTVPVPEDEPHPLPVGSGTLAAAGKRTLGLRPIPPKPDKPTQPRPRVLRSINVDGKPTEAQWDSTTNEYFDATGNRITGVITPYSPPKDPDLITAVGPGGTQVRTVDKPGVVVPGPQNTGAASIKTAVAQNRAQLKLIDDALGELAKHPDAVGMKRAIGDVIPPLGGVADFINQRQDPGGVAARAQIANVGSWQIKDRSGAAVTISEFPRLAPFVPRVGDTPQTIRIKLQKLREGIEEETRLLELGGGTQQITQPGSSDPEFDALMATVKKKKPPT